METLSGEPIYWYDLWGQSVLPAAGTQSIDLLELTCGRRPARQRGRAPRLQSVDDQPFAICIESSRLMLSFVYENPSSSPFLPTPFKRPPNPHTNIDGPRVLSRPFLSLTAKHYNTIDEGDFVQQYGCWWPYLRRCSRWCDDCVHYSCRDGNCITNVHTLWTEQDGRS